jgi:hypothetical protein
LLDQGAIQLSGCFQLQAFKTGGLLQLGEAQAGGQATIIAFLDFPIYQQSEAFQESQTFDIRHVLLIV